MANKKDSTHKVIWSSADKKFVTKLITSTGTSLFDGTETECNNKVKLLNVILKKKKRDD